MQMIPGVDVGLFCIDDSVLAAHGITDLEKYSVTPVAPHFIPDFLWIEFLTGFGRARRRCCEWLLRAPRSRSVK
jgi:hypothetical protein